MTTIVINSDGILINGVNLYSRSYEAYSYRDEVGVRNLMDHENQLFKRCNFDQVSINGAVKASAAEFVSTFNGLVFQSDTDMSDVKANTDYPSIILSTHMVCSNVDPQSIAHDALPGYAEISAPDTNTGDIYLGNANVDANSCHIAPGRSKSIEHSNLAAWYVLAAVNGEIVDIHGSQKP